MWNNRRLLSSLYLRWNINLRRTTRPRIKRYVRRTRASRWHRLERSIKRPFISIHGFTVIVCLSRTRACRERVRGRRRIEWLQCIREMKLFFKLTCRERENLHSNWMERLLILFMMHLKQLQTTTLTLCSWNNEYSLLYSIISRAVMMRVSCIIARESKAAKYF